MAEDHKPPQISTTTAVASPSTDLASDQGNRPRQVKRRNRTIASCLPCRQRKIRCDKLHPCTNCNKFSRQCLYIAPALDTAAQQELAELKDKLSNLEQSLGQDVVRRAARSETSHKFALPEHQLDHVDDLENGQQESEGEDNLEPTPFASYDQLYDDGDNADDELFDLGIAMGKLRVSDRVGGLVRPRLAQELDASIRNPASDSSSNAGKFLPAYQDDQIARDWSSDSLQTESCLLPGPNYMPPASSFFFPNTVASSSFGDFLPTRTVADQLFAQYLLAVHPVARLCFRPALDRQYVLFWDNFDRAQSPPAPVQALIFAAMFSAAVSLSEPLALQLTGMPKQSLVDQLQTTTEMSLSRARFLQTTRLDTLQAFVMYLVPLCRDEISRAHSALVGAAIRLAQCMGLHRDGLPFGFSAVDTHVRRLVWYQLCYLDMRTAEATGPLPQIRKEEYDTKLPLNVNDDDLLTSQPPVVDSETWTEMTPTRVKIECYHMIRQLWDDMQQMDSKKTTLTATLGKIQTWRATVGAKFMALMHGTDALHILAQQMYRLLSNRFFIIILQRYSMGTVLPMPQRLRQILLEASLCATESGIIIDTLPELTAWAWYRPALIQYHGAILLLLAVYSQPELKEAPRIWACIDYVFGVSPGAASQAKAEGIIRELRDRIGIYQNLRKVKASSNVDAQISRTMPRLDDISSLSSRSSSLQTTFTPGYSTGHSPVDRAGGQMGSGFVDNVSGVGFGQPMIDVDWVSFAQY